MQVKRLGKWRFMKATQCIPKLRGAGEKTPAKPTSLMDRLREAVFKILMISAASRSGRRRQQRSLNQAIPQQPADSYRSQAVEDCIEFVKKSAASAGDEAVKSSGCDEDKVAVVCLGFSPSMQVC